MPYHLLSKTHYLNGLQCPKYLWILFNEPERIPEVDIATQRIFDQGHQVGELARQLFPGGILVPTDDFKVNLAQTKELIKEKKTLFEAGFLAGNIFARADILKRAGQTAWDIIEVKSSTTVKEVYIHDVAFQRYCCEKSGLQIKTCNLMFINNQYVRKGEIDPSQLFTTRDITAEVNKIYDDVPGRISEMLKIIAMKECPALDIGPYCNDPYGCPITEGCWNILPENHIFTLYFGGKKSFDLYNKGIVNIEDIPSSFPLNSKQCIQRDCVASGKPYADKKALKQFLAELEYPLYFLDFETFGTAIPLFDDTRPYQNIPFQFSLHMLEKVGSEPKHYSFLAEGRHDPRQELMASLSKLTGRSGSIVAYNKSFEKNILQELGEAFPEYSAWTESVISRLVDLMSPFRSFHYYHPSQEGSVSLKSVLPAVTGEGYQDMAIARGDEAGPAFLRITFVEVLAEEIKKVREDLLSYCKKDTEGMLKIAERLRNLAY